MNDIQPCSKCGKSFEQLMAFALLQQYGAKVSRNAGKCFDGEDHQFFKQSKESE
jgi:hypothetical protein